MNQLRKALSFSLDNFYAIISKTAALEIPPNSFVEIDTLSYKTNSCMLSYNGYKGKISFYEFVKIFADLYEDANVGLRDKSIKSLKKEELSRYEANINLSKKIANKIDALGLLIEKKCQVHGCKDVFFRIRDLFRTIVLDPEIFIEKQSPIRRYRNRCSTDEIFLCLSRTPEEYLNYFSKFFGLTPNATCDDYKTLGLTPDATDIEVRNAYKKLALQFHPDKNPNDPQATAKFQEIQRAFEMITGARQPAT